MRNVRRFSTVVATALTLGAVALYQAPVAAGSASASLSVSASVSNNCTISTSALDFGAYDPIVTHDTTDLDGTGGVTITCTKGATTTIDLGLGSHASGTQRRLNTGSNYLNYEMYQDAGRITVWGTGADTLTPPAAPSKAPRSYTVYGRVSAGQDVEAGSYTDTVTATVNF